MEAAVPTTNNQKGKRGSSTSSSKAKRKKTTDDTSGKEAAAKRQWTPLEDQKLVECLHEIILDPRFKNEAGFKPGFLKEVERLMAVKIPGCDLKVFPHIDSRYRLLKRQYGAITEMLGPKGSGFRWNDKEKYVDCDEDVFTDWVKSHPHAKGLRRKAFPYYEDFTIIWGKDRATGERAQTTADACDEIKADDVDVGGLNGVSMANSAHHEESVGGVDVDANGNLWADVDVGVSDASTISKKKSKNELTEEIVYNINRMADMYKNTNDNIGLLAECFKHEAVLARRMEKVLDEIMKIEGLTISQKTRATEVILSNTNKVIIFFNLAPEYRAEYVLEQLV